MIKFFRIFLLCMSAIVLIACEKTVFPLLTGNTSASSTDTDPNKKLEGLPPTTLSLEELTENRRMKVLVDAGFIKAILQATDQSPDVLAAENEVAASRAKLSTTEAGRDTQFKATALGGVEDLSDETAGVAAILTANRMIYDGGILEAKIDSDRFYSRAAEQAYLAVRGERAFTLSRSWIELEKYQSLKDLIDSRLSVLDPLLVQLEKIAAAGVGDVSQVAQAQRVVSTIIVAETEVSQGYEQAKIAFLNDFGRLPVKARYPAALISKQVPTSTVKQISETSPGLMSKYWAYRAAEAAVVATKAQDKFSIGFEVKVQQPFGGSGVGSDESFGLALSKSFYQGDKLQSQVRRAEATAQVSAAQVTATYRKGELMILAARETIKSMDEAILLAKTNAQSSREEIEYLRKQLIIGGSTLESVLSAEARLYEAESKEIVFIAERRKAESTILAISGRYSGTMDFN
jgi:outer membrane protein TolC